jgi:hypothetical protein
MIHKTTANREGMLLQYAVLNAPYSLVHKGTVCPECRWPPAANREAEARPSDAGQSGGIAAMACRFRF